MLQGRIRKFRNRPLWDENLNRTVTHKRIPFVTIRRMAEAEDNLREWADKVRVRAFSILRGLSDRNVASMLTRAMNQCIEDPSTKDQYFVPATEAQVAGWLSGEAAPRDTLYYRAMMQALELPLDTDAKMLTKVGECYASDHLSTIFRKSLDRLYEEIPEHKRSDDPLAVVREGKRLQNRTGISSPNNGRKRKGNVSNHPVDNMTDDQLLDCLKTTEEPGYFIRAVRKLKGWSQPTFFEETEYTKPNGEHNADGHSHISGYETGATLPSASILPYLKNAIAKAGYGDHCQRFEDIVIYAWLKKEASSISSGHIDWLPPSYWKCVLEQCNTPEALEARSPKPLWAERMIPIQSKADYLYAMQHALGLESDEVVKALGVSVHIFAVMNDPFIDVNYQKTKIDSEGGIKVAAFYENGAAVKLAAKVAVANRFRLQPKDFPDPLFVREIYDALPDRRERGDKCAESKLWTARTAPPPEAPGVSAAIG